MDKFTEKPTLSEIYRNIGYEKYIELVEQGDDTIYNLILSNLENDVCDNLMFYTKKPDLVNKLFLKFSKQYYICLKELEKSIGSEEYKLYVNNFIEVTKDNSDIVTLADYAFPYWHRIYSNIYKPDNELYLGLSLEDFLRKELSDPKIVEFVNTGDYSLGLYYICCESDNCLEIMSNFLSKENLMSILYLTKRNISKFLIAMFESNKLEEAECFEPLVRLHFEQYRELQRKGFFNLEKLIDKEVYGHPNIIHYLLERNSNDLLNVIFGDLKNIKVYTREFKVSFNKPDNSGRTILDKMMVIAQKNITVWDMIEKDKKFLSECSALFWDNAIFSISVTNHNTKQTIIRDYTFLSDKSLWRTIEGFRLKYSNDYKLTRASLELYLDDGRALDELVLTLNWEHDKYCRWSNHFFLYDEFKWMKITVDEVVMDTLPVDDRLYFMMDQCVNIEKVKKIHKKFPSNDRLARIYFSKLENYIENHPLGEATQMQIFEEFNESVHKNFLIIDGNVYQKCCEIKDDKVVMTNFLNLEHFQSSVENGKLLISSDNVSVTIE